MGQDLVLQKNVDIFNQVWKEKGGSNYQLSVRKLKKIQKLILKEYPFLESIHESMLVTNNKLKDCPIIFQNAKFTSMTQYVEKDILGVNCRFLQGPKTSKRVVSQMREALTKGEGCHVELINYRKDGTLFMNDFMVLPVHKNANKNRAVEYFIAVQKDIIVFSSEDEAMKWIYKQRIVSGSLMPSAFTLAKTIYSSSDEFYVLNAEGGESNTTQNTESFKKFINTITDLKGKYLASWKTINSLNQRVDLVQSENEDLRKRLDDHEESKKERNYSVFKEMQQELVRKEEEMEKMRKEMTVLKMKDLEITFSGSYIVSLEEENNQLKKELEMLREARSSHPLEGDRSSTLILPEEESQSLPLLKVGNNASTLSSLSTRSTSTISTISTSSVILSKSSQEDPIKNKVEGMTPYLITSKKVITDNEGNILEVSFNKMLENFTQMDGENLANYRKVVFTNFRKIISPIEMLISLIEMYCDVPKGENQKNNWRKIVLVIEYWISNHFEDFGNEEIQFEFFSFLDDVVYATLGIQAQKDLVNTFEVAERANLKGRYENTESSDNEDPFSISSQLSEMRSKGDDLLFSSPLFSTPRFQTNQESSAEEKEDIGGDNKQGGNRTERSKSALIRVISKVSNSTRVLKKLMFNELEISQQLTLLDQHLFKKLNVKQMLNWVNDKKEYNSLKGSKENKGVSSINTTFFSTSNENSETINNNNSVFSMINHFNNVTRWVATSIVSQTEDEERVKEIEKMVEIGHNCLKMNSFNMFVAIMSTINSFPIQRMKKTIKSISIESKKKIEEMDRVMNPSQNYKALRDAIQKATKTNSSDKKNNKKRIRGNTKSSMGDSSDQYSSAVVKKNMVKENFRELTNSESETSDTDSDFSSSIIEAPKKKVKQTPFLPYFGLCLQDICFIEESNPNLTEEGLVNFQKFSMIQKVVDLVTGAKQTRYTFAPNKELVSCLFSLAPLSEEEVIERSKQCEN